MKQRYYTIGMAGHIDHGKTTLTKALTNVDTDRLKEEKERKITIELGYAPFMLGEFQTSIVDVPGHERFIRQMIAGVAGIDLVLLVVAADEGVMPQTKEHLEILSFLGIEHGIIAVTKLDRVEDDFLALIEEDIRAEVKDTVFEQAEIVFVDSLSGKGLDRLIHAMEIKLAHIRQRDDKGTLRLPIDQVFSLQGHGTIVRGTIYEGKISEGETLTLLPHYTPVKVKQLQVHGAETDSAIAGQRVAVNLSGVGKSEAARGDVLVSSKQALMTTSIDISLQTVKQLQIPLKQRAPIKFYTGTSELMGKIVFFDRNELNQQEHALCQIRLDKPVAVRRGDRFVIRRPSPVETIGGGWVLDPFASKYRFGEQTIAMLRRKMEGTPEERVLDALNASPVMTKEELAQAASVAGADLEPILLSLQNAGRLLVVEDKYWVTMSAFQEASRKICARLEHYHIANPMRAGQNKAECIQELSDNMPKKLLEYVIDREIENGALSKRHHYIALASSQPQFPAPWKTRLEQALRQLETDRFNVSEWEHYVQRIQLPANLREDVKHFLLEQEIAYALGDPFLIHRTTYETYRQTLYETTGGQDFTVQDAKSALNLSRKWLLPFLELLDQKQVTKRAGDKRQWTANSRSVLPT